MTIISWKTIQTMALVMKNQVPGTEPKRIVKNPKLCKQKISTVRISLMIQGMVSPLNRRKDNQWWQTKRNYLILQKRSPKVEVFCVLVKSLKESFPQFSLASLSLGLVSFFLVEWSNVPTLTRKNKIFSMIKKKIRSSASNPLASQFSRIPKTSRARNSYPKNLQ